MGRRANVVVLGSYSASSSEEKLAAELGSKIANFNVNIISGGQKGVMYSLCEAAWRNRSDGYQSCYLIGLLPKFDFADANEYIDLAIPTGAPHLQNSILPIAADVVIAIGGSAGTLTEISIAWQRKKPIALLGAEGWAGKLGGKKLDNRREDSLPHFICADAAASWISDSLS